MALGEVGVPRAQSQQASIMKDLWEGASTVASDPLMRAVMIQNVAMGVFFMGAFIVAFPLVVREIYDGTSSDLASLNAFNSLGLVITIGLLLRIGHVARAGRALLLSQFIGSLVLALAGWAVSYTHLRAHETV